MARFGDNPIKPVLSGNEIIPATDPSTGNDVGITPVILQQFAQANIGLAMGSTNGLMTGPQSDKLNALYTQAQFNNALGQLAQQAIPLFIGAPTDGFIEIYQHVLSRPIVFGNLVVKCSAGSTNAVVKLNGVAVTGWSVGVTSAGATVAASALNQMNNGDVLGVLFSGTTGNCANARLTMAGTETLAP